VSALYTRQRHIIFSAVYCVTRFVGDRPSCKATLTVNRFFRISIVKKCHFNILTNIYFISLNTDKLQESYKFIHTMITWKTILRVKAPLRNSTCFITITSTYHCLRYHHHHHHLNFYFGLCVFDSTDGLLNIRCNLSIWSCAYLLSS
jgi:hypothetical protein